MSWLGRDAPGDAHLARVSLFNHIIFGLGIALWVAVMGQSEIQLLPSPGLRPTVIPSDT